MPTEIYFLKVGMNMTEGVIEEWYVADGDVVQTGELLYRLETEKVNMDVDAETSGTVKHSAEVGVTLEPGEVIGFIFAQDEKIPDVLPDAPRAELEAVEEQSDDNVVAIASAPRAELGDRVKSSPAARRLAGELSVDIALLAGTGPGGRIVEADVRVAAVAGEAAVVGENRSSPLARRRARELNVDIAAVKGSGPGGRVTKDDVEGFVAAPRPAAGGGAKTRPVTGMRRTIATRMHESLQTMAQLTMDMDVAMNDAVKLRTQLVDEWAEAGVKPTYTDLVIRAVAKALERHPVMNASWGDKEISLHGEINVGMAVALEEGLIVPVVRGANSLSMRELSAEAARLAEAARTNRLGLDELQGGTFTVSALGMFGVDSFTPIINSPQAGILGVNRIREDVGWDGDRPVKVQKMNLSLTWDHRVLDGAPAAHFLAAVKEYLEAPYRLLV